MQQISRCSNILILPLPNYVSFGNTYFVAMATHGHTRTKCSLTKYLKIFNFKQNAKNICYNYFGIVQFCSAIQRAISLVIMVTRVCSM